jgi:thiosulfate/3-mercaptopyruvate sulfurtransferase
LAAGPVMLIDTRKVEEYKGIDADKKSNGHLSGAISINYKEFLNADGSYKTKTDIEALAAKSGVSADKDIVLYCNSGVLAAVGFYALHEILGYQKVVIMEGGYNHWVLDPSNTLEK